MFNKKIASELAIGTILLISIGVGTIIWMENENAVIGDKPSIIENTPVSATKEERKEDVACIMDAKLCDDGSSVGRIGPNCEFSPCPGISATKAGYKVVEVKNPLINFSFEAPASWMTETRNSGEKALTLEEKRSFLIDHVYGDYTKDEFLKMSEKEIGDNFDFDVIASVTNNNIISYSDISWGQIDFALKEKKEALTEINELKKNLNATCFSSYLNKEIGENGMEVVKISEIDSLVFTYPVDFNEDGVEIATKSCNGGQGIYIELPVANKMLYIGKQSKGDAQYELDFKNLLQSVQIKPAQG